MALFTDGLISSLGDLLAQDTQLASTAGVEGIDVTQKLTVAQEDIALEITTLLNRSQNGGDAFWLRAQPKLENIVVTKALKLWHTCHTLELVYSDAFSSQLNDRYAVKGGQFRARAKWAYERLLAQGIGITWSPVPVASAPQVVSAGGNLADGTYYVSMSWLNSKGEEGAASAPTNITTTANTFLVQPGAGPSCATGWNVYAGVAPEALFRQNGSPLALQQTWIQPSAMAMEGSEPGCGQAPNYEMPLPRMIPRG